MSSSSNFYDPLEQFNAPSIFYLEEKARVSAKFLEVFTHTFICQDNYHFVINFSWIKESFLSIVRLVYYSIMIFNAQVLSSIFWSFLFFIVLAMLITNICVLEKITLSKKAVNPVNFLIELFQKIAKTILKENTNLEKQEHFATLYFVFMFVFISNIFGLVPFAFTITSSFAITFFIAGCHFIAINLIAIYKQGWNFFGLFLPAGVPIFISPFLVIIEIVSYIAKVFSLSIRLFANMMSGHALLKILIGFSWSMLCANSIISILAVLPWLIVTLIFFLELLIAFLQAYVFVILLSIYINDVFNAH